jgi:hypothetical protein
LTIRFTTKGMSFVINDDFTGTVSNEDSTRKFTVNPETLAISGSLSITETKAIRGRLSKKSHIALQASGQRGARHSR